MMPQLSTRYVAFASICSAGVFGVVLSLAFPEVVTLLGFSGIVFLIIAAIAPFVALNIWQRSRYAKTVLLPLEFIVASTRSIAQGARGGQVEIADSATTEIREVANAISKLAQRAKGDIDELTRLERVRSEFIANVSHELRTPIFSVQGYLETLLDGAMDDPEVAMSFIEKAYSNALRLNALLSDLIDISRIESGELKFSFRFVNIMQVLADLLTTIELKAEKRGVRIVVEPPLTESVVAYADRDRIAQVITNLIDNAVKYNVQGGKVTISVVSVGDLVTISVTDTGIGIPLEHQSRIFERFYRVDKDRSREVGGTGLGLAIVKHIVEAHHSVLNVKSEQGVGTTISFSLKGA